MKWILICCLVLLPVVANAKDILVKYDDFLTILADKERMTALLKQATDQNRILVKLTDEQGTTIALQAKQIARCESIMRDMDQLGKTDSEIARVITEQLQQELRASREQNVWSFGGGIGIGVLIGAALMWLF